MEGWATDWEVVRAKYHLRVTAKDNAALRSIEIEGEYWESDYNNSRRATVE